MQMNGTKKEKSEAGNDPLFIYFMLAPRPNKRSIFPKMKQEKSTPRFIFYDAKGRRKVIFNWFLCVTIIMMIIVIFSFEVFYDDV